MQDLIVFDMKDEGSKMYGLPVEDGVVVGLIKFHRGVPMMGKVMTGIVSIHHESKTKDYGAGECDFFRYCQVGRNRNVHVEDLPEDATESQIRELLVNFYEGKSLNGEGCC